MLGYFLNLVLPGTGNIAERLFSEESGSFMEMFSAWIPSTVFLVIKMTVLIFMLNILQRLLAEFGIIRRLAKFLAPLLLFFGLPKKTAFLWIVANILGLAYGAAVMIDESERGAIGKRDADLLNLHISVSHSNLEDMFLFCSVGGIWYALLFPRLFMAFLWVWIQRALYYVSERFSKCNG